MSRTKHLSKTVLAIFFWVIVFVISAEILLRISCNYCTWSEANGGDFVPPYAIDESPHYLVREKNWSGRYTQPEFDYEIRTNSLGFRDIEHPTAKTHGEYRILAIGDSFTEGQGAPFEQTPMRVLIHNLNHNKKHQHFTMLNAGVAGSDPFYGFRIMVDKLLAYQPDLVMIIINDSDVKDVIRRGGKERFLQNGRVQGVAPPQIF